MKNEIPMVRGFYWLNITKCSKIRVSIVFSSNSDQKITRGVLGFEIGAQSLVEVLPVVKVKSDQDNLYC